MLNINIEALFLNMSYFLPGYIMITILSKEIKFDAHNKTNYLFQYLLYSLINIFVYSSIDMIWYVFFNSYLINDGVFIYFVLILRQVLLPIALARLLIVIYEIKIVQICLVKVGLNPIKLSLTCWDHIFYKISKTNGQYFVIDCKAGGELNDRYYCKFGINSFVSEKINGVGDIYIEEVFESIAFEKSLNYGIYLTTDQIKKIYFLEDFLHKENEDESKKKSKSKKSRKRKSSKSKN